MKRTFASLAILIVSAFSAHAGHFDFDTTDVNCSILIREIYLTTGVWAQGDEIGVLTPEGRCGGATSFNGFPIGIAGWGDDGLTRDSIEGFRAGDSIYFVRWDATEQQEIPLQNLYLLTGDGIWHDNGLLIVELAEDDLYFDIHPTLYRHKMTCPSAEFFVDDYRIGPEIGDQIAIRTPDGNVGGILIWVAPDSASGWAYEDNPDTEELVEGFHAGDPFQFSYHSSDSLALIDSTNWLILRGNETFTRNGNTAVRLWNEPVSVEFDQSIPYKFELSGAYPNPFNGRTMVYVTVPFVSTIQVSVVGVDAKEIFRSTYEKLTAGIHQFPIDLESQPSGSYICKVITPSGTKSISLILEK